MLIIFTSSAAIRTNGRHSFDGMEDDRYHPFDLFHMDDKLDDGSMDNNYNSWKFPDGIMLDKRARLPSEAILLGKRRVPAEAVLLGRRDLPNEGILLGR
ncbi:unnamed protein product [Didymodactylos carnosus]|uniref:Uncharacterized protein n=1 Tax=Didymodactylos carnosus TaxID=1234261 RepID=A0A814IDF4_9BILA|nr:unnamed protein product [Didymodactylos carnosus]CAF1021357.1 unnamed protein product [Didymodactylos carnosus]CAF3614844.1 unnamed protein product [Didymodactylos carnosus]CAF3792763.1 unnamed protein product [Didymodactylos carnosus]